MIPTKIAISELLSFSIGGGWGEDQEFSDSTKVNVIRGTDFSKVFEGDVSDVPVRYEKNNSVKKRACRSGDIILEISGGSAAKGQYVGRVFFVTDQVLSLFEQPVIPASFCRLLRFNPKVILPRYAYFHIRNMYLDETISIYEVQSTGISNFQFTDFISSEVISVPSLEDQQRIVSEIGNFEDFSSTLYQEARTSKKIVDLLIAKHMKG
jgi:type I restriction enzyme S subunit